jgi:hypothetical protein
MSEQEKRRERMVYMGLIEDTKKKTLHVWARIDIDVPLAEAATEAELNDVLYFSGKNLAKGKPGIVYDFDVIQKDGASFIQGDNRDFVGSWPSARDRTLWQTKTEAVKATRAARNKRNQELGHNAIFDALEPIRKAYAGASATQKRMILAYVIARITTQ